MKINLYTVIILLSIILYGCSKESIHENEMSLQSNNVTIKNISDSVWIYFSFESGKVVGTSRLLNTEEDNSWAKREDWDIAICGDKIRTNSGTSGNGQGGIQIISDRSFNAIDEAPINDYLIDNAEQIVKK